jgi:hypothetical protein
MGLTLWLIPHFQKEETNIEFNPNTMGGDYKPKSSSTILHVLKSLTFFLNTMVGDFTIRIH